MNYMFNKGISVEWFFGVIYPGICIIVYTLGFYLYYGHL